MKGEKRDIKLFTGNSNPKLANEIASRIGLQMGKALISKFSDGETRVSIEESVRGFDCYIIQSLSEPVNDNIMELLLMTDAMKRASCHKVTAVIPYFGYARQDRKAGPRDPISAKVIANLLTAAGVDRILTMELHTQQIQGFFDIPLDHLIAGDLLSEYYRDKFSSLNGFVAVSPDMGSSNRTRKMAEALEIPIAIVDKRRPRPNVSEIMNIVGDIEGKNCIMVDDMIDTGGTIANCVAALKQKGALDVYVCCTHALLSGSALERLENSGLKELVSVDTIELPKDKQRDFIKRISCANKFARAIERISTETTMDELNIISKR